MKRLLPLIFISVFSLIISGCAGHLVRIKGERIDTGIENIAPGSKIFVVEKNSLFLPEKGVFLKPRIIRYLEAKGITDSDHRNADYYLVFGYSLKEGKEVQEPVQVMVNFSGYADFGENPATPAPTVQPVNPAPIVMDNIRSVYETKVSAKLIDGHNFRKTGNMNVLWSGTATAYVSYPGKFDSIVPLIVPVVLDMVLLNGEKEIIVREKVIKTGPEF